MTRQVTLGEELLLLALNDRGSLRSLSNTRLGIAGGALIELTLAGRIELKDSRLHVLGTAPTGTLLLDRYVEDIAEWAKGKKGRRAADWITRRQAKVVRDAQESLTGRGVLEEERGKALGLFPTVRHRVVDPHVAEDARRRLTACVVNGVEPEVRTAGLVSLVHHAKLHRVVFPDRKVSEIRPRMVEISEGEWAGEAVRKALQDMQAIMAITTATVVTGAASS